MSPKAHGQTHPRASPLAAQALLRLAQLPGALHVEAQQSLLQVPRAAGAHKVPEGAVDALPAALHGEGTQAQLPVMEAVGDGGQKWDRGGQDPAQAPGEVGVASVAQTQGPGRVDGLRV